MLAVCGDADVARRARRHTLCGGAVGRRGRRRCPARRRRSRPATGRARDCRSGRLRLKPLSSTAPFLRAGSRRRTRDAARPTVTVQRVSPACGAKRQRRVAAEARRRSRRRSAGRSAARRRARRRSLGRRRSRRPAAAGGATVRRSTSGLAPRPRGSLSPKRKLGAGQVHVLDGDAMPREVGREGEAGRAGKLRVIDDRFVDRALAPLGRNLRRHVSDFGREGQLAPDLAAAGDALAVFDDGLARSSSDRG